MEQETLLKLLSSDQAMYGLLIFYITMMIAERIYFALWHQDEYDNHNALGSVGVIAFSIGFRVLFSVIIPFTLYLITFDSFRVMTIPVAWWSWIIIMLTQDFIWYVDHSLAHRVSFYWAAHHAHHSSEKLNFTTAGRAFIVDGMFRTLLLLPLALLGFRFEQLIIILIISDVWGIFVHSDKIPKLGWMDRIFATPSNHRVHHGKNAQYIDKNYGHVFIFWDRLFGTYEPEEEKVVYGVTDTLASNNPTAIYFGGFRWLGQKMKRADGWQDKLRCLVMPPDWEPASVEKRETTSAQ